MAVSRAAVEIFTRQSTATALLSAFAQQYGVAAVAGTDDERWDPRTVGLELAQDFGRVPPENLDKLMTAAEVLTSDSFERSLSDFIRVCNTLSDSPTDGDFDPAEPYEMAWAILEVGLIRGRQVTEYHEEIRGYVRHMLLEAGLATVPEEFVTVLSEKSLDNSNLSPTIDPETYETTLELQDGQAAEIGTFVSDRFQTLVREVSSLLTQPATGQSAGPHDWAASLLQELQAAV